MTCSKINMGKENIRESLLYEGKMIEVAVTFRHFLQRVIEQRQSPHNAAHTLTRVSLLST